MTELVVHNPNKLPLLPVKDMITTQGDLKDLSLTNYNKLKASIEKHGFIYPIAIWLDTETGESHLLDGHQRKRYLDKEHPDAKVPVINIPADSLAEAAEILLKISSQYGRITQEGLDEFIQTYELEEADLYEAVAFDALPLLGESEEEEELEDDEPPEPDEENTYSEEGKVYQLGEHLLMCGDSTNAEHVNTLLQGQTVKMIFTDPPYGIDYSGGRTQVVADKTYGKMEGDKDRDNTELVEAITIVADNMGGVDTYICLSPVNLKPALDTVGNYQGIIVWKKPSPGLGYQFIRRYCEFIIFKTSREKSKDDRSEFDYWEVSTDQRQNYEHGTQKPIALPGRAIKFSSQPNDVVLDLYGGSGSTLMAADQLDRRCITMELDPKFADVIRRRYWRSITGNEEGWQEGTVARDE